MQLQTAGRKALLQCLQQLMSFLLATAMADRIVCVAFKGNGRMAPAHPRIKRIVQKQIGQQWADDTTLRRATLPGLERSIRQQNRGLQPSVQVEHHPALGGLGLDRAHQQVVIDSNEKPLDVEIENPVGPSAALTAHLHRLMR